MGWALRALWGKWVCATVGEGWEGHSRAQPDASYSWPLPILSAHLGRNRYFPCTLPCWVPPPWHGIFSADQCYSKYTSQLPPVLTCLGVLASILDIPVIVLTFQILCYLMKTWGHNLVILVMATCYHMKINPWVGSSLDDQVQCSEKVSVGFSPFSLPPQPYEKKANSSRVLWCQRFSPESTFQGVPWGSSQSDQSPSLLLILPVGFWGTEFPVPRASVGATLPSTRANSF